MLWVVSAFRSGHVMCSHLACMYFKFGRLGLWSGRSCTMEGVSHCFASCAL